MAFARHAIFALGIGLFCFAPMSAEARCNKIGWNQKYDPAKGVAGITELDGIQVEIAVSVSA